MSAPVADQQNHFQPAPAHLQQQQSTHLPRADSKQQPLESSTKAEPGAVKEEYEAEHSGHQQSGRSASQPQNQEQLRGGERQANGDSSRQRTPSAPSTSQPEGGSQPGSSGDHEQDGGAVHGKQVSTGDIQRVQNYIEKCLQMYLSQKEVVMQLQQQFKVEPCFTQLVWQKLEEQNQEFFRAYYTRLKLKDQIILFNHLLDEQVKMFQRMPRGQMMPGMGSMQSRQGVTPGFPQPMGQAAGASCMQQQQPDVMNHLAQPPASGGFVAPGAAEPASQPAQLNSDPGQMHMSEFPGMGIDGASADLPPDLAGMSQSLPFSGSEMNLAGMVSIGSPGRGTMGGVGDHVDLSGLPRNFSLSDLALDQVNEGDHSLPRNISLSDLPALDLDSVGEHG